MRLRGSYLIHSIKASTVCIVCTIRRDQDHLYIYFNSHIIFAHSLKFNYRYGEEGLWE